MRAARPEIVSRDVRYREACVVYLRELADRIESGDLQDALSVHVVCDRGDAWHLSGSAHLDTVRTIGQLEWIKTSLLERLMGRDS